MPCGQMQDLTVSFSFIYNDVRSRGKRGATVQDLRGTKGADFEGEGMIHRGVEAGCCGGLFFGGSDPMKERYILVKGTGCFVFASETALSPLYAIKLDHMAAELKDKNHHEGRTLVLLRAGGTLGDVQYEISFSTPDTATAFQKAVTEQASLAATDETRKRLGHDHLISKRASVRYAESIAKSKEKEQPDKPVTRDEVLKNMEEAGGAAGVAAM